MYKISVITPSIRPEGIQIVEESLRNQTFKDFEWLICNKKFLQREDNNHIKQTRLIDDFEGGYWTLNRVYNKLIRQSQGELIVSWQDNIWIPPTGLQQFWDAHEAHPEAIITGVGDQYEQLNDFGKPMIKIWSDPRKRTDLGSFYECNFPDVEWNWCAIPRKALFEVGGFDEILDTLGFGMDGYQINERLNDIGKHFFIDQDNESFTLRHDRSSHGGQENWDKYNNLTNGNYQKRKEQLKQQGTWSILDFLKKT